MDNLSLWIFILPLTGFMVKSNGSEVIRVSEGSDVILPCSLSTKESVVQHLFVWRKDGEKKKKEVFMYNAGFHYNNGLTGQDVQFRGRVSHFPDQMKSGNASIRIINTTITDTGDYTCVFPRLNGGETFNVKLVVDPVFKDRSGEISGAVPKPTIMIADVTDCGVQLKCEVLGAPSKPELQWKDSDGNILDAEKPEISEKDGRYHITLQTTVTSTKTNCFQCVVQQKDLNHEAASNITVPEKLFVESCRKVTIEGVLTGIVMGVLLLAVVQAVLAAFKLIRIIWIGGTKKKKEDDPETKKPLNSNHITV